MTEPQLHAVTGAFGYSGKYIAQRLLEKGHRVITLTNSLHRENPFGKMVQAHPFNFDRSDKLSESLKGVFVLYNTDWVKQHADILDLKYTSEMTRRKNRVSKYKSN